MRRPLPLKPLTHRSPNDLTKGCDGECGAETAWLRSGAVAVLPSMLTGAVQSYGRLSPARVQVRLVKQGVLPVDQAPRSLINLFMFSLMLPSLLS